MSRLFLQDENITLKAKTLELRDVAKKIILFHKFPFENLFTEE